MGHYWKWGILIMRYYAQYLDNKLIAIGTGPGGIEITEAEYNTLLAEIRAKAQLVDDVYSEVKTLDDVPVEWKDEIQRRVIERHELEAALTRTQDETEI